MAARAREQRRPVGAQQSELVHFARGSPRTNCGRPPGPGSLWRLLSPGDSQCGQHDPRRPSFPVAQHRGHQHPHNVHRKRRGRQPTGLADGRAAESCHGSRWRLLPADQHGCPESEPSRSILDRDRGGRWHAAPGDFRQFAAIPKLVRHSRGSLDHRVERGGGFHHQCSEPTALDLRRPRLRPNSEQHELALRRILRRFARWPSHHIERSRRERLGKTNLWPPCPGVDRSQ